MKIEFRAYQLYPLFLFKEVVNINNISDAY